MLLRRGVDHLRVWRGYFWHHGIYVGDQRVVRFGGGIFDNRHACVEEVGLSDLLQGGRVEVVPKQQRWIGLWGVGRWHLPPALPPEEIDRRARWLAASALMAPTTLWGATAKRSRCGACAISPRASSASGSQSVNASVARVGGLTYAYLNGRGRLPVWAQRAMLAFIAVRAALLGMYYRHNKRFYRDVRLYYAEHRSS